MTDDYGSRASGFYVCPNHFAGFLECALLMMVCLAGFARLKLWIRIILGYFAFLAAAVILISGSRGNSCLSG
jgi:hypothetical protein